MRDFGDRYISVILTRYKIFDSIEDKYNYLDKLSKTTLIFWFFHIMGFLFTVRTGKTHLLHLNLSIFDKKTIAILR